MKKKPRISIVIPTFNRDWSLERAIKSVISQTYKNWELIIIDDGSTDKTKNLVSKYLENPNISYFYQKNNGVCSARNKGFLKSKGDYISFLDSDDEYATLRIEKQLQEMVKKKAVFSLSNRQIVLDGKYTISKPSEKKYFLTKEDLIKLLVPTSATLMMFEKDKVKLFFDEDLPSTNDFDFLLRVLDFSEILFIEENLNYIHKTLSKERISTDYSKKILGYKRIFKKYNLGEYVLNQEEAKLLKSFLYKNLSVFLLLDKQYIHSRSMLKSYLKLKIFNFTTLKLFSLFLLSYSPWLLSYIISINKYLWRKNLIKV